MFNTIALQTVQQLVLFAQPMVGMWQDQSALLLSDRLHELGARLQRLGLQAKALDLLLAVPGA